jgi:GTP-binding protein
LPGYGYAKVPEAVKKEWHRNIDEYLQNRQSIKGLVLVMDIRHPLKEFDLMMLDWSGTAEVPIHILLTKADKFKRGAQQATMFSVKKQVPKNVTVQVFSAQSEIGKKVLVKQIETWVDGPEETTIDTNEPI